MTVTRDGKKLEYDGIYRKRSNPGPDQFLTVGAGQTHSSTFQVSDAFDMTKAGVYSIAVDTYLRYVVGSATSKPDIKRKNSSSTPFVGSRNLPNSWRKFL